MFQDVATGVWIRVHGARSRSWDFFSDTVPLTTKNLAICVKLLPYDWLLIDVFTKKKHGVDIKLVSNLRLVFSLISSWDTYLSFCTFFKNHIYLLPLPLYFDDNMTLRTNPGPFTVSSSFLSFDIECSINGGVSAAQ